MLRERGVQSASNTVCIPDDTNTEYYKFDLYKVSKCSFVLLIVVYHVCLVNEDSCQKAQGRCGRDKSSLMQRASVTAEMLQMQYMKVTWYAFQDVL